MGEQKAGQVANLTFDQCFIRALSIPLKDRLHHVYGIPNGGIYAAYIAKAAFPHTVRLVEDPESADTFIDDIIDSGATRERYWKKYGNIPFFALVDKKGKDETLFGTWISFPWERQARSDGPQDAVTRILQYIGEDPAREGLRETPDRVVRSYAQLFAGYQQNPADVFKVFDGEQYDEMVLLRELAFESTCEHHMLPFAGYAHIAYIPDGKVIGVSKLARLLEVFSRRLQVQERLTTQITQALDEYLKPLGSACVVEAQHACMMCRGVRKRATMVTSSLTGAFRQPEVRAEFFSLVNQ